MPSTPEARTLETWPATVYEPPPPVTPTYPGWNPPNVFNNYAARTEAMTAARAEAWQTAVNQTPKTAWTQATIDATRDYRYFLPTLEEQSDSLQACYKTADIIFPGQ